MTKNKIDDKQTAAIVVDELKAALINNIEATDDPLLVDSIKIVLAYWMLPEEYNEFIDSLDTDQYKTYEPDYEPDDGPLTDDQMAQLYTIAQAEIHPVHSENKIDRFTLEQQIHSAWGTIDDLKMLTSHLTKQFNKRRDVDSDIEAIVRIASLRFETLWATFEELIHQRKII
jgi:hypothetical protein